MRDREVHDAWMAIAGKANPGLSGSKLEEGVGKLLFGLQGMVRQEAVDLRRNA